MLEQVKLFTQSSIRIEDKDKTVYIDPFRIPSAFHDADFIFITHDHYDHFSSDDIDRIRKQDTVFVMPKLLKQQGQANIIYVEPQKFYEISGLHVETIAAYNRDKPYHPKSKGWVGYIITLGSVRYYISGDTDITKENSCVTCDVAFVPVGGVYTMDVNEAAELINKIKPKIAVPTHYGSIVGSRTCGKAFAKLVREPVKTAVFL